MEALRYDSFHYQREDNEADQNASCWRNLLRELVSLAELQWEACQEYSSGTHTGFCKRISFKHLPGQKMQRKPFQNDASQGRTFCTLPPSLKPSGLGALLSRLRESIKAHQGPSLKPALGRGGGQFDTKSKKGLCVLCGTGRSHYCMETAL